MGAGRYFTILGILFINFLVMIVLASRLKQHFIFELFILLLFLMISLIMVAGIYNDQDWASKVSSLFFILFIINIYYMYINATHGALISNGAAFLAAVGFLVSVASIKSKKKECFEELDEKPIEKDLKEDEEIKVETYGSKTEFKPGKYVGSKTASNYHIPKCDWAKKIKKKNQVWFNNKQQAAGKGYKKHSCVK